MHLKNTQASSPGWHRSEVPNTQTQLRCQVEFWQSSCWFRISSLTRSHLFPDGNNEPCQREVVHFSLANLLVQQVLATIASGNYRKGGGESVIPGELYSSQVPQKNLLFAYLPMPIFTVLTVL